MGAGVPRVHRRQRLVALVDRQHRALGAPAELGVGDDDGELDDPVALRYFHWISATS